MYMHIRRSCGVIAGLVVSTAYQLSTYGSPVLQMQRHRTSYSTTPERQATVPVSSTSDPPVPLASIQPILITAIPAYSPFSSLLFLTHRSSLHYSILSFSFIDFLFTARHSSVVKTLFLLELAALAPLFATSAPQPITTGELYLLSSASNRPRLHTAARPCRQQLSRERRVIESGPSLPSIQFVLNIWLICLSLPTSQYQNRPRHDHAGFGTIQQESSFQGVAR